MASSSVCNVVNFSEICGLVERISRQSGHDKKKGFLIKFIEEWRATHARLHSSHSTAAVASFPPSQPLDSFYSSMRLLIPQCDKARVAYGIKEYTLAKLYIELLGLSKESVDAKKLLHFKSPKHTKGGTGDFAEVAYFILKNRCPEKGSLTIKDVNDSLNSLADGYANKRKDQVKQSLMHLLKNTSALEQKWLIRMIMKDLKCGLSQLSVLNCYHEDAEAFYDVTQDLYKVCTQLHDPHKRMHEIAIALFSPFRPMLADRGQPSKIMQQVDAQSVIVEVKFDGERVQLHKDGDEFRYWSRNGNEWTHTYGANSGQGNLTPFISKAFHRDVRNCILDGEMMGYNHATETMGSKAEDFDIKRGSTAVSSGYEPCFIVFDVVLLNDQVLSNQPLKRRKELLKTLFQPMAGRLLLSEWKETTSKEDCLKEFNDAIDNREEGIMVKRSDAIYSVATRKGGWWKLKPEYVIGLSDEVDCLVLAGYFGSGHRSGMIAQFLCCVAEDPVPLKRAALSNQAEGGIFDMQSIDQEKEEGSQLPRQFLSLCKVGTGYSKAVLYEYNQRMAEHWQPFDKKKCPAWLQLTPSCKEKPDVWIEPSKSFIVQVRAAEFVQSDSYATGFTLRFPRVDCFRADKAWHECITLHEIEQMRSVNQGKMSTRHATMSNDESDAEDDKKSSPRKRRQGGGRQVAKASVMSQYVSAVNAEKVETKSIFLQGKEFCVLATNTVQEKHNLEQLIAENGGHLVQNPGQNTFCVVANKMNLKVANIIKSDRYDVVKPDWLLKCVESSQWIVWEPRDFIHTSFKTKRRMAEMFDCYGDSFVEPIGPDTLLHTLNAIKSANLLNNLQLYRLLGEVNAPDVTGNENEMETTDLDNAPLLGVVAYIADCVLLNDTQTKLSHFLAMECRADLLRLGAMVQDFNADLDSRELASTTHCVIIPDITPASIVEEVRAINRSLTRRIHIVSVDWVKACVRDKVWKVEQPYHY